MYKPLPNGTTITIGEEDLAIDVHLPPIGFVWNYDAETLERTEIICRSSTKKEQYWQRPKWPENYIKKAAREKELQQSDPEYVDPELKEFRAREWHRRLYGAWFMNNGEYVYLTGEYYFYLAHWTIDVGPPSFKIADLHKAYFWKFCQEDPLCYGMLEMTKRRVGKTYFGSCMLYEYVSRTTNAHAGIQSKTASDARVVFSEKLIQPWRKLIDIFRPDFDKSKGDVPKSELRFFKTSAKGSKVVDLYEDIIELESWIDFQNSGTHAYDSQKMLRYLCDEVFKTIEADILKRHKVVKPCLENESGEVIGKAIYTSTVEEMEGFLDLYFELWRQSDHSKKNKNGKTESGLYRWFTPAQKIMYVDKYGYPDEARALTQIENDLAGMEDPRDKSDYIRKNPRTWKEAFKTGGDNCLFDPMKLDDRLSTLYMKKESDWYKRYNLVWEDVPEGDLPRVRLVENKNGRFRFAWNFADKNHANDVMRRGNQLLPKNNVRFVIGIDPFDHNRTRDGKFSMGAAAVYMKYDPLNSDMSDTFVAYYLARPSASVIFYEDMVMLCHYFSCQMLFEDNKPKIGDHFIDRGYGAFLVRDEKGHAGISASPKTHQVLAECIEDHLDGGGYEKFVFHELGTHWRSLDLDDTTKWDLAMASGYARIAAARILRKEKFISKLSKAKPLGLMRKYKIKNRYAKRTNTKLSKSLR